jgi:hypothetical protein
MKSIIDMPPDHVDRDLDGSGNPSFDATVIFDGKAGSEQLTDPTFVRLKPLNC